jgi:hypothetical protein
LPPIADDVVDPDLLEDYDYSIDEHAAVDEVRAQYDEDDLSPPE